MENAAVQNSLVILKTPNIWTAINSRTNFSKGAIYKDCKEDRDCNTSSRLFIQEGRNFGHLYIKKLKNSAAVPKRATEGAAGYDITSAEETVVSVKGKAVVKTGISIATPEGCYGRIAPRSGLAVKKYIDVGTWRYRFGLQRRSRSGLI